MSWDALIESISQQIRAMVIYRLLKHIESHPDVVSPSITEVEVFNERFRRHCERALNIVFYEVSPYDASGLVIERNGNYTLSEEGENWIACYEAEGRADNDPLKEDET